ncbi:hypothetical protein D3C87_1012230 [compost metagenome]
MATSTSPGTSIFPVPSKVHAVCPAWPPVPTNALPLKVISVLKNSKSKCEFPSEEILDAPPYPHKIPLGLIANAAGDKSLLK